MMPREKEGYRDHLEMLADAFPDKKLLNAAEVARWAGRDVRMIRRLYFGDKVLLTHAELARKLS